MSWLGKKPGRPKEQGGHRVIKGISVDEYTWTILQIPKNRSQYIEYCIKVCTHSKSLSFCESSETFNGNHLTFVTAAEFVWTPNSSLSNAILSTICSFKYQCTGEGLRFKMTINDKSSLIIEETTANNHMQSQTYNIDFNLGIFTNQDRYVIKLQFEPSHSSDIACIKDVHVLLEVVDGLPWGKFK